MPKAPRTSARMSTGRKAPPKRPVYSYSSNALVANTSDSALIDSDGSMPGLEPGSPPPVKIEPVASIRGTRSRRRAEVSKSEATEGQVAVERGREDDEGESGKDESITSQRGRGQDVVRDQSARKRAPRGTDVVKRQSSVDSEDRNMPLEPAAVIKQGTNRKSKVTAISTIMFTDDEEEGKPAVVGDNRSVILNVACCEVADVPSAITVKMTPKLSASKTVTLRLFSRTFDDEPAVVVRTHKGKNKQRSLSPLTDASISDVDRAADVIRTSHMKEARKQSLQHIAATNPGDGTKRLYGETTFIHGNNTLSDFEDESPPSTPVRKHRKTTVEDDAVPSSLVTPVRRSATSSTKPKSRSPLEVKERMVYMEDLESRGPIHRGHCEINNEDNKDPIINYDNLPPLKRRGELMSWSGVNGQGQVRPSAWSEQASRLSMSQLRHVIHFIKYGQMYNPSRINPDLIGRSSSSGNAYLTVAGQPSSPAVFVTSVMITSSNIVKTKEVFGEPRRVCTGIAHNYEWQRMEAALLAALGEESANAQIAQNSITFSTARNISGSGSSPAKNPSKMFMRPAGHSSGGSVFARAPMSLQGIQTVPVLDARGTRFNMTDNLPKLDTILPPFKGEIPEGACAWIGYTVNKYSTVKGANVNFNLLWIVVLGTAD
ncbi:hypothetical protein FIBSPDRAFT_895478 [Athelia psychrophila]|uniref:Uncharacterized protein n=1 Tax=Athelia psychrophila TaxID=1759441 RepID=A0A166EIL6_9AGAM|nr:hypothetical protein FIBSPDRAFT_895478 [Fibularhizoctonia sp. CBS 109695]